MALSSADSFATFDDSTGNLDISPVLSAILLKDTTTLGLLGFGPPALTIKHNWNEDSLNANTVTGNNGGQLSAAATSYILADASKIRIGTLLKDQAVGKTEVMQVTNIATNTLTVVRGYGSTSGQTHATDAVWTIVGQPVQEGDETISDISAARSTAFNYMQHFKRTVKIADEQIAVTQNGIHPGVSNEFEHQIMRRTQEMMVEFNTAVILGIRAASAPSDSVYATMGGLIEYVSASGGNSLTANKDLTEARINELYRLCWDDGGDPSILLGPSQQIRRFADFNSAKVRIAPSERMAGVFVNKYLTDMGRELSLHTDRWMPNDTVLMLDPRGEAQGGGGGVDLVALKGRELMVQPLAKIGSATRGQIVSSWSLEVRNATKAHGIAQNLTQPPAVS